ncbi:MAG TPA: gliding motility-associated ABC transporter substrate-binding protein GldG [Puia sp.]|jgi:ABC-2 type transport system permease protein|nr:gliding motility-associated ABC transporter substrate-binding protein GldG [Puia sp.]
MWAICKKELRQFFSSLTGYIAIIVFLLLNGLLLFVFPDTDILSFGYATLDKFFELAPWILLLLIPAITMRSFSEEFRMGTYETLQTMPLGRGLLIGGKWLASLIVVVIALLPTLIYFLCIQRLSGQGGIDTGATTGSYLGLLLLAAVFTSIGTWCSSWTTNPVVAFIVAAFACFLLYSGFGAVSALPVFAAGADYFIGMLGIDAHYRSISRGVVDLRDVLYSASVIFLFLFLTARHLAAREGARGRQAARERRLRMAGPVVLVLVLIAVNLLAAHVHYRLDLTKEKRYTLSEPTKHLLARVDDNIQIDLYLAGDLKPGFRKLASATEDELREFNEYCDGKIRVHAFDPLASLSDTAKVVLLDSLHRMGLQPYTQIVQAKKGEEESQRVVLPAAVVHYKDRIYPINLLKGIQVGAEGQPEEQEFTNAETLLEYKFGSAIDKLITTEVPLVGYVMGNGEPLDFRVYDLVQDLRTNYRFGIVPLDSQAVIPLKYNALVIVKPTKKFTDREKLTLDQYLLHGGQIIWAVDMLHAEKDSLRQEQGTIAYDRGLGIEDLFFKYGVRVNQDLIEDRQCANLNMVVGMQGDKPQFAAVPWPYFPLLSGSLTHPISKNLDPVFAQFANSIDTVKATGIRKTVLLQTSANATTVGTPAIISFDVMKYKDDPRMFPRSNIPVAMLLEGKFQSLFANRVPTDVADSLKNQYNQPFLSEAENPSRVIVISDGDIFMNEVAQRGPMPMGYSQGNDYTFSNKDFLENSVEYLVNPSRILETRSKDYTLRLLDPTKVEQDRKLWQFINIGLPLLLVVLGGYVYQLVRRQRFAR